MKSVNQISHGAQAGTKTEAFRPLTHSCALQFDAVPKSVGEVVQSATLPFSELRIV